jgi:hypothetical protein
VKQIISWLQAILSRSQLNNPPIESEGTNRSELNLPREMQDLVNDSPPSDNGEYELEATMGDITAPNLKIDDPSSSDADEPIGIDPYDTAKLHKK